jgi:1,4-dihydroxy-2-naphthoate octaprenyltransferase
MTPLASLGAALRHRYVRHLRLNFNLFLSPIYLWGAVLAGGELADARRWLGFVSLHLFLYGGTNAFNSYYDRDEGPIGGLLEPPPVDAGLLRFSLIVQALGLPLALPLGWPFVLAWLTLFLVATAYSHPAIRLKADPYAALLAVALGQGGVGFVAGWLALWPEPVSLLQPAALLGMLTTALILAGLYVVTQSYQVGEDRARGDRTLPVLLGVRRALLTALAPLAFGGGIMAWWAWRLVGVAWTLLLLALFLALGGWLLRWALRFDEGDVRGNFRRTMRFAGASSGGLSLLLLWLLL